MLAEIQITGRAWDGAHIKSAPNSPGHFVNTGSQIVKEGGGTEQLIPCRFDAARLLA